MEPRLVAEPRDDNEVSRWRRAEARPVNVDGGAGSISVHVDSLYLQAEHAPVVEVEDGDLCRLAVRKPAKQVQVARLGQPAGHFGLTQETDVAPPLRPRLNNNLFNARGGHSEPFDQALRWDEP